MIFLLLFLTNSGAISAQQYPDYYAVRTGSDHVYNVFTRRIMECPDPVYESGDERVLVKLGHKWIIGRIDDADDLECENINATVDKVYESTDGKNWTNVRKASEFNRMLYSEGSRSSYLQIRVLKSPSLVTVDRYIIYIL